MKNILYSKNRRRHKWDNCKIFKGPLDLDFRGKYRDLQRFGPAGGFDTVSIDTRLLEYSASTWY